MRISIKIMVFITCSLMTNFILASIGQFQGSWMGSCQYKVIQLESGKHVNQVIPMSLFIKKKTQKYSWQIQYSDESLREYVLEPSLSPWKNHYILDEKNGLKIHHFLIEDTLHAQYQVNGKFFLTKQTVKNGRLFIDTFSYWQNPMSTKHSSADFKVDSYPIHSVTKCALKKNGM